MMRQPLSAEDYLLIADSLSPAPRILPRLLDVLNDPASDVSQVVELISFDPGLTSRVLRASNSAFVGLSEPARDVSEAVNQLGISFVYQLTAAACGASTFQSSNAAASARLWQHSATAALAAQLLADDLELDQGLLFTAALLHDLGKAVFAKHWEDRYWSLLEQTRATPSQLPLLEEQAFNLNHGELGGRVLAHWKFPPAIAASVWHHHAPLPGMPFETHIACVTLANTIAEAINERPDGKPEFFAWTGGQERALAVSGLTGKDLNGYLARTQENFEFVNAMCQIGL